MLHNVLNHSNVIVKKPGEVSQNEENENWNVYFHSFENCPSLLKTKDNKRHEFKTGHFYQGFS